jgi:hypothetical protein
MTVDWSYHMTPFGGHPATTERFRIDASGTVTASREDGDLGWQCTGHVDPKLHRAVVAAARAIVAGGAGCARGPAKRDMPSWSVSYSIGEKYETCSANRDAPVYQRFEQLKEEASKTCKGEPRSRGSKDNPLDKL